MESISAQRVYISTYMIRYAICFISVIPMLCSLMGYSFNGEFSPAICGGYLLFVTIGYQLTKIELSKKMRIIIYLCGAEAGCSYGNCQII